MAIVDAQDSAPASLDGEGQDGKEPPNNKLVSKDYAIRPAPGTQRGHVPLPPPDASAHPKEPGRTHGDLAQSQSKAVAPSMSTASSYNASLHSISPSEGSPPGSAPSTRPPTAPPSRVASRAPSMSGERPDTNGIRTEAPKSVKAPKPHHSAALPHKIPAAVQKAFGASAPSTPEPGTKKRPSSVKSENEEKGFFRNALNSATPKITRRSSQRSTGGSSRKSDSDGGARSVAGDSVQSLSKKYGICERVAIGKGATSVVRLAHKWDRNDEKLYAVKEFRKRRKNETEKEYVKKLTAEFCISSTLHHINIVETVDLVQDESSKWCEVMEFCGGGDLYAAIKKGHMSPGEIECCFKQILTGVSYLHSQGVAHRDLKPENIFFNYNGHLKIGDYGASTVYRLPWEATVHMSTGLCGSEPYIAPEQFLGKPYDARLVDIWAIGVVYYCLHFQELPWRVAQLSDPLYQAYVSACANPAQTACPPTINHLSPRSCRPLIRRMLEPDPKKRALIDECLQHAWTKEIVMCYEQATPTHIHVHADSLAKEVPDRAAREREA